MAVPSITLNNGCKIPQFGLGTWLSKGGEVESAVRAAIDIGYRHIDTAFGYGNHGEVGRAVNNAINDGKVKREELYITSKIWNTQHSYEASRAAVDLYLSELQLDYLDLVLIHWPQGYKEGGENIPKDENGVCIYSDVDYLDTWKGLESKVNEGKIKSIGVSNFNHKQIQRIIDHCTIKPTYLQIELHPYYPQRKLQEWCKANNILLTAYSPLANPGHMFRKEGQPNLLEEPILKEIGHKHNKTPAQIALRWFIQRGLCVIPKSISKSRLEENFNIFDFELSQDEMAKIDSLDRNFRIMWLERDTLHPHYPFSEQY